MPAPIERALFAALGGREPDAELCGGGEGRPRPDAIAAPLTERRWVLGTGVAVRVNASVREREERERGVASRRSDEY